MVLGPARGLGSCSASGRRVRRDIRCRIRQHGAGKRRVASGCDAKCDAIWSDRVELLARAVILVAGINLADAEQAAVFARVVADLTSQRAAAGTAPYGRLPFHELLPERGTAQPPD